MSRCAWARRCEANHLFFFRPILNTEARTLDWIWYIVCVRLFRSRPAHPKSSSSSPGIVVANTQSVGASLAVWIAAGILGWTGASSFAELGASIPVNGGAQAYLAYAYGPLMSYLFTWTSIALRPGSNAVIGLIFGTCVLNSLSPPRVDTNPQLNM